jgi:hypothetical protein
VEGPAWAPSGHPTGDWRCAGGWLLAASCGWRKPDAAADNGLAAAGFGLGGGLSCLRVTTTKGYCLLG